MRELILPVCLALVILIAVALVLIFAVFLHGAHGAVHSNLPDLSRFHGSGLGQ